MRSTITNQRQVRCLLLLVCICIGRGLYGIYTVSLFLLCVLSVFPTEKWAMTSISETFFLFFFIFHDRNVLSLCCEGPVLYCNAGSERSIWMNAIYPARTVCQLPRAVISYYYSFFRCRRRYCSRTNNLCTRFCRNKTKISIHASWLTPFKCVFYLGGSIAVFPCREISLTTSAASIKNQFIQLRRKGNQLLGHLAS
jgi:hypothetical protein